MIKYEHNTLVLDASHTKYDQKAVNDFIEYVAKRERERVLSEIETLESRLDRTRTPVFDQSNMFKMVKETISNLN